MQTPNPTHTKCWHGNLMMKRLQDMSVLTPGHQEIPELFFFSDFCPITDEHKRYELVNLIPMFPRFYMAHNGNITKGPMSECCHTYRNISADRSWIFESVSILLFHHRYWYWLCSLSPSSLRQRVDTLRCSVHIPTPLPSHSSDYGQKEITVST